MLIEIGRKSITDLWQIFSKDNGTWTESFMSATDILSEYVLAFPEANLSDLSLEIKLSMVSLKVTPIENIPSE